jgi:L-arabinose transport system substrate-binding protein
MKFLLRLLPRPLAVLLLLLVGLMGLSACRPSGDPDRVRIGFIVKQPEEPWFQMEWQFAEMAGREYGFDVIKLGAVDGERVLAAIDSLAAQGAKGFVICTPEVRLGPAIAARARQHGLKFMSVDDRFLGSDGQPMADVPHLGISAFAIGKDVGLALVEEMNRRGWSPDEVGVCLITFDELDTAKERTDGVRAGLKEAGFPENRVYATAQRTSDVPGAFDATNVLLTRQSGVKRWLVAGMNDSAVIGAVRAFEGRGLQADSVVGIGINGTDCLVEFEKREPTGFFASQLLSAKRHGYETASMVFRWVSEGIEPAKETHTTGILINRDNYRQIYQEQGLAIK